MHRFPFYKLKIDRAFVSNIAKDIASKRLVNVIASSAIDMELDIVAEGIEERQEFGTFTGFRCHNGQGFFMARLCPISKGIELIEKKLLGSKCAIGEGLGRRYFVSKGMGSCYSRCFA